MGSEWSCNEIRMNLFPFIKSELDQETAQSVQRHISNCGSCSREANEIKGTLEILSLHCPPLEVNSLIWTRLSTRILHTRTARGARNKVIIFTSMGLIAVFGALCLLWLLLINNQVVGALRDTLAALGLEMAWLTDSPVSTFLAPLLFIVLCSIMTLLLSPFLLKPMRKPRPEKDLVPDQDAFRHEG